jgi:5-methylcytosine-specific restriction endonuclease McrA
MKSVPVARLSNDDLVCELKQSVAHDCTHTARQVALIAEVERRRLYAPAGYPSMFTFCVGELHLPEDAAYKRIQVARVARCHPAVLTALAEGRVHLTGLNLMAAHFKVLPPAVVNELLEAATHRSKKDIELLLAQRFPKADLQAEVRAIPSAGVQPPALTSEPADERPEQPQPVANTESELAPAQVGRPVIPAIQPAEYARVAPLAPQRYGVQFTMDQTGHDLLRQVQDLLGHEVPRSDLAEVFVRALKAYATLLAKQKHAATEHPRVPRRQKPGSRHISAHVKRVVQRRDKGQCTYVNDAGHRCEARSDLEYDHAIEFARGGEATASNIRLRCHAHNQYGAERTYGTAFMQHKREQAADAHGASVTAT